MPYAIILTYKDDIKVKKAQGDSIGPKGHLVVKDTLAEINEIKRWAKSKGYSCSKIAKTPKDWK